MITTNCLNCEKELTGKFCSGCGQATDTHRITFTNFIFHDVLHGTFHLEKGILFTVWQALIRPGQAALDYISGKRRRYYNVFYLILILFGFILFLRHFNDALAVFLERELPQQEPYLNEASEKMIKSFPRMERLLSSFLFH